MWPMYDNTFKYMTQLMKSYTAFIEEEVRKRGFKNLALSHGSILLSLDKNGEMQMQNLSVLIGKTPQTVTALVNKLENLGYVQKTRCVSDKRSFIVSLTNQGHLLAEAVKDISADIYKLQRKNISDEDFEAFRKTLVQINDNFTEGKKNDI